MRTGKREINLAKEDETESVKPERYRKERRINGDEERQESEEN